MTPSDPRCPGCGKKPGECECQSEEGKQGVREGMTDIVPFLRGCDDPMMQAAADETERLRAMTVSLIAAAVEAAVAEEREACARLAEKVRITSPYDHVTDNLIQGIIARDIRARGGE